MRGKDADPEVLAEMNQQRARLEKQISTYQGFLAALETEKAEAVDLEEMARLEAEAEAKKAREGGCTETVKLAVAVIKNAISGIITVWLYMMDLISDYQVWMLCHNAARPCRCPMISPRDPVISRRAPVICPRAPTISGDDALLQRGGLLLRLCLGLPARRTVPRHLAARPPVPEGHLRRDIVLLQDDALRGHAVRTPRLPRRASHATAAPLM